jgi:hypothetical protein
MTEGTGDFPFNKVYQCKIHPGIGIARVGNSPTECFIGPEIPIAPQSVVPPDGAFKDHNGQIKRQAARFRIYAYDSGGNNLGELPLIGTARPDAAKGAHVRWTVHLKNKKGAWYNFHKPLESTSVRNCDIKIKDGAAPDSRTELVIDPGPRGIDWDGSPVRLTHGRSIIFDTGSFRGTTVPLGELKVDCDGRLLVLGGFGRSDSDIPGNPIGLTASRTDYWVNNDHWYDDISDGPVTATVTLPDGKSIPIDQPEDAAWVVVCPPDYAPGTHAIVTLYDVMREVAINAGWMQDFADVSFQRDIRPILERVVGLTWVNGEAQRGHGYGKRQNFLGAEVPRHASDIKNALRNPTTKNQATPKFMPPLSGDDGPRTIGAPSTWLTLLPSQYEKFEKWADSGDFTGGAPVGQLPWERLSPDDQVDALQRAALEPCVGGPFYPGVEMPGIVKSNAEDLYVAAFRINSAKYSAGDITKALGLPWQATFYARKDTWWPSARPDDVVPQEIFEEANNAWLEGQPPLSEALEGRVKWDRGLGVTTLFRRPWINPVPEPEDLDDPHDAARRGCDDMVRYWHELGFVLPRQTAYRGEIREIVHVEMERRPYAGMDVRELFHCLLNLERHRPCLPKVKEYVESVLAAARRVQQTPGAFAWMENIRPFEYSESLFDARMDDIYDDCSDFAFTKGFRKYDPLDKNHNPSFRTREQVIERIRQLTPFNFLDGSWLRNIHRVGPVDEVNAILFTILMEELGNGVPSQNHANIYRDLCHSFGFYPPPLQSIAFARDPAFLDCAFDSPTFQLGISEFTIDYYPEIIGMSLWLEWTVLELHRIASIAHKIADLDPHFYKMHIAIDNAVSGHGAGIVRAVKLYLTQIRNEGGEEAVQEHWKRIWDGYVAFAYTFVIVIQQIRKVVKHPPTLQQKMEAMIRRKALYGRLNHSDFKLGTTKINDLFVDPPALLNALASDEDWITPGDPDNSKFFELLEYRGGRMYHVFTEEEIKLWREWIRSLGQAKHQRAPHVLLLTDRIAQIDPVLVDAAPDRKLATWQKGASDHRIALWAEIAAVDTAARHRVARLDGSNAAHINDVRQAIDDRSENWLAWSMVRTLTFIAASDPTITAQCTAKLADIQTGEEMTIAEWFARIRMSSNPAIPACAFLRAVRHLPDQQKAALLTSSAAGTVIERALSSPNGSNDGKRGYDTVTAWLEAGCPLPKGVNQKIRPLRLDASLDEEETHPIGVAIGFGTVH